MESQTAINTAKGKAKITISFDPDLTTKTQVRINSHPSNEADASLRDSDLEDMVNSSQSSLNID